MTKFNEIAEGIAKAAVKENFLDKCEDGKYEMGGGQNAAYRIQLSGFYPLEG